MRARLTAVALLTMTGLVAGCGSSDPETTTPPTNGGDTTTTAATTAATTDNGIAALSAKEILAKAISAIGQQPSARIKGSFSGQEVDSLANKTSAVVHLVDGAKVADFIAIDSDLYFKGNAAIYLAMFSPPLGAIFAASNADTWTKTTTAESPELVQQLAIARPESLLVALTSTVDFDKGSPTTVDGHPAIELKSTSNASQGSIFIATTGDPLPLKITDTVTNESIVYTYGDPVNATPPAGFSTLPPR